MSTRRGRWPRLIGRRELSELRSLRQGSVSAGAIPTVAPYVPPRALTAFRRAYSGVAKAVREGLTTSLPAWLADADLDLPVMSLLVKRAEFVSEPLLSERMLLAAPTRHWLWRQRRPVTFRDFVTEPLLLLKDGHCFGDDVLEICRRFRCDPHVAFEGGQFDILAAVVATGAGVTLLPETDRYRFRRMGLGLLDFVPPQPVRRIGIAPLKHKFLTPAGRALIVVLRGACRGPEARGRTKSTCA